MTHSLPDITRRACLALLAAAALASAAAPTAAVPVPASAAYPQQARVTIVVPFAPGVATDIIARLLADELGKRWNSPADLAGQQIDMQFDNLATALAFASGGTARALAVTSATRADLAPELPTLGESGLPQFEAATWLGLLAPAGTPGAVVATLEQEVAAVFETPVVRSRLAAQGFTPRLITPDAFRKFIEQETTRFGELIRANQISVE